MVNVVTPRGVPPRTTLHLDITSLTRECPTKCFRMVYERPLQDLPRFPRTYVFSSAVWHTKTTMHIFIAMGSLVQERMRAETHHTPIFILEKSRELTHQLSYIFSSRGHSALIIDSNALHNNRQFVRGIEIRVDLSLTHREINNKRYCISEVTRQI